MTFALENCTYFVKEDPSTHPPHMKVCGLILLGYREIANEEIPPECYQMGMWNEELGDWEFGSNAFYCQSGRAEAIFWLPIATVVEDEIIKFIQGKRREAGGIAARDRLRDEVIKFIQENLRDSRDD
jgi:hypothetical protein